MKEDIQNIGIAFTIVLIAIYVLIKSFTYVFFPQFYFTIVEALILTGTFVSGVFLLGIYNIVLEHLICTAEDEPSNTEKLLLAAILSNDGELKVQNYILNKIENGQESYTVKATTELGVTKLVAEKME